MTKLAQTVGLTELQTEIIATVRDAPFLLIGECTSEIQKSIISKRLLAEYRVRP
jgi:alkylation response protein AidB-like acyl-CoA dehydrogenase